MKKFIFILLFFSSLLIVNAQQDIPADSFFVIDAKIQIHDLRPATFVLADSTNQLTLSDIASGKFNDKFKPVSYFKKFNSNNTYWLRLSLANQGNIKNWWLLLRDTIKNYYAANTNTVRYSFVDVYFCNQQNQPLSQQRTGVLVPRSQKSIKNVAGICRILFSGKPGEKQIVYLKIYGSENLPAYLELHDPAVPLPAGNRDEKILLQGGIIFFFSLFSFCLFFFIKDKAYLFFGIYTLLLTVTYLGVHSRLPFIDWFVPEHPLWYIYSNIVVTPCIFIFFLLFGRSFINLPSLSKQTDTFLKVFIGVWIMEIIIHLIVRTSGQHYFFPYSMLIFSVLAFGFVIRFVFFKNIYARLFVAGGLWLLCFTILGILDNAFSFMPFSPWSTGQLGQLLIFAVALAYKIKLNEQAKAESDKIKNIDEIKSRFFANISHEFRTPLTLIQGPLQQIEEQATGNKEAALVPLRHIKTMRRHTDRLLELVNQLLDLSRIDSGKMKLQIIKGDVLQMLKVLTASFESMAERKGIHYHTHFPEQTIIAFFDKDKLEKIVTNLLGNALKYTPEQGTVSVIIENEDNRLRISVEDSGTGINKKELDKVFDRFYQVEGTEDKGSGIGLALVKEMVDLYGGQISVSSEPGKGSRFKVSLPIDKHSFKENEIVYGEWRDGPESVVNKSIGEKEDTFVQKTISLQLPLLLIVEDNNDLRNFICETVQHLYQVIQAVNGKEGFEKAVIEIPDVIVSDVMMPVMDGFTMAEKLKRDERTSHIPVILLTAKAGQQHKLEGLQTGADDYLLKPFDAKELLTRIQNLINQRKLLRKKFAGDILLKPSEVSVNSADENFLTKVMEAIETNMQEDDFGVEQLAKAVAMSRSQLHRKLIALTGQSPSEVLRTTRLLRAKELLVKKAATPSEIAFKVGFNSHTYFSKCFKEEFGISPSEIS